MATYKLFRVNAEGKLYAKATKTLVDPVSPFKEAYDEMIGRFGKDVVYRIFEVRDNGELVEFGADIEVSSATCVNGHLRATWWTITKGGRKYCRKCATEASKKSKAKAKLAKDGSED